MRSEPRSGPDISFFYVCWKVGIPGEMATRGTVWPTSTVVVEKKTSPWWWVLPAALLVGLLVAYMNRQRLADAMGMSVVAPRQTRRVAVDPVSAQRRARRTGAQAAPVVTPAMPVATATNVACAADGMPKPFNVYQDNLSGSNDITVGPGVAFDGVGAMPANFSGQCSGVNPAAVWQSSQLLPGANCGQALDGTSDWSTFAPSDPSVVNFLSAATLQGVDTISTSLKNASLDLRPEPSVSNSFVSPWNQSSFVQDAMQKADWSHSLVA